jgi:uncharacterized protein (TIGR03437 family)
MNKTNLLAFLLLIPLPALPQTIVNLADFDAYRPLAPGSIAVAFGDFAAASPAVAGSGSLPTFLGGLEVRVAGVAAPIFAVTKSQVNFLVPFNVTVDRYAAQVPVEFRIKDAPAGSASMFLRDVSPGILVNAGALRPAVALNEDGSLNAQANPARPGEILTLNLVGQGTAQTSSNGGLLLQTVKRPIVFFRTWRGETLFSGPSVDQPGLWQVKVRLPQNANLQPGATPIVVLFDGLASNTATVWIIR